MATMTEIIIETCFPEATVAKYKKGDIVTYIKGGKKYTSKVQSISTKHGDIVYGLSNAGIVYQSDLEEEHGAGEVGTDELRKKYEKDTPNEAYNVDDSVTIKDRMFDTIGKKYAGKIGKIVRIDGSDIVIRFKNGKEVEFKSGDLKEDINPASATTTSDIPIEPIVKRKDCNQYDVNAELFRRFKQGRNKFERWSKYFDMTNEEEASICNLIKSSKKPVILRNSDTGAMISLRKRANNES